MANQDNNNTSPPAPPLDTGSQGVSIQNMGKPEGYGKVLSLLNSFPEITDKELTFHGHTTEAINFARNIVNKKNPKSGEVQPILIEKNPFKKKLFYPTDHLKYFKEMESLVGLYGKHYLPIKKARWYQLLGGVIQKPIILGNKFTDTRINCLYPIPTESGKNDLVYLFKDILPQINKSLDGNFSIEEPLSYHPEQLIGKVIEVMIDNPNGIKPKKIKVRQENRGFFNSDFIEIDEANSLFFSKDEQMSQAREYISKALNPIGRNEVVKKLVEDLPTDRVSYFPNCTFTLYFQPLKKINEELFLQGFLRRFLIPVGIISPFLNYGNKEDFRRKITPNPISKYDARDKLIAYLDNVRSQIKDRDFIFTEEAVEKINYYLEFLIAEGQVHSEKISNLTKLMKWTFQDYLIRMSCIVTGSFYHHIVTEDFVALAYMDLVEFLQSTFDFVKDQVYGNFDYNTGWQGAGYKERLCLEFLYNKKCFSFENSGISIGDFQEYIQEVYKVKEVRAREIFAEFKRKKWVEGKQKGQYETKVWLTFIPQIDNLTSQGDKGDKGYVTYESIYSSINTILEGTLPLSPSTPSIEKIKVKP